MASPSPARHLMLFFSGRNSTELENNSIICVIEILLLLYLLIIIILLLYLALGGYVHYYKSSPRCTEHALLICSAAGAIKLSIFCGFTIVMSIYVNFWFSGFSGIFGAYLCLLENKCLKTSLKFSLVLLIVISIEL